MCASTHPGSTWADGHINNANLHAGGLGNTGWDLAFNLGGGLIAAAWPTLVNDQWTPTKSTTKTSVSLGPITPPAP